MFDFLDNYSSPVIVSIGGVFGGLVRIQVSNIFSSYADENYFLLLTKLIKSINKKISIICSSSENILTIDSKKIFGIVIRVLCLLIFNKVHFVSLGIFFSFSL